MFKYAEMLMVVEDDKVCELIFKQQDDLILIINDRFPRIIIKKYRTLQGKVVWLWILPFVIKQLIVCALCVNRWFGKSKYHDYYLLMAELPVRLVSIIFPTLLALFLLAQASPYYEYCVCRDSIFIYNLYPEQIQVGHA